MAERVQLDLGGVPLSLGADRSIAWADERAVFVADLHLGKAASYRSSGVPAPEGVTRHDLDRLSAVITGKSFDVQHVIVLGDLVHDAAWDNPATRDAAEAWFREHSGVEFKCVLGNHDRKAGSLPANVAALDEPHVWRGLELTHDPTRASGDQPALAGHIHPAVVLTRVHGVGRSRMRAACFWLNGQTLVLPAFGSFTGAAIVPASIDDRAWAVGESSIVEVGGRAHATSESARPR